MKIQDSIQEQIHMEHVSMRQSNIALSDKFLQNRLILTEPVLNTPKVFRLMKHFCTISGSQHYRRCLPRERRFR